MGDYRTCEEKVTRHGYWRRCCKLTLLDSVKSEEVRERMSICTNVNDSKTWMEGIRNAMTQRNLKDYDWKDRKVLKLGCENDFKCSKL